MNTIKIANLKCGGCEHKIKSEMEKSGLTAVSIDHEQQTVSFEGNAESARSLLSRLGYPPADSQEAKSLLKKGKSYLSCLMGKTSK